MPHHKLQSKWFFCTHSIILHRETHESELMRHSSKALSHMHKCRANMSKIPEVHMWDEYFLQEFPAGMTKPEKPHPQALSAADHRPVPHNLPLLKLVMLTMSITHATIDHKRRWTEHYQSQFCNPSLQYPLLTDQLSFLISNKRETIHPLVKLLIKAIQSDRKFDTWQS